SEIGWTMPIAPASEIAATSSGLLQGYIAPPTSGTSIPASRVSAVAIGTVTPTLGSPPLEPPDRADQGHQGPGGVLDGGLDRKLDRVGPDRREGDGRPGDERAPCLLAILGAERSNDAADIGWQRHRHREPARELAQVDQRHGVNRAQVIANRAAI